MRLAVGPSRVPFAPDLCSVLCFFQIIFVVEKWLPCAFAAAFGSIAFNDSVLSRMSKTAWFEAILSARETARVIVERRRNARARRSTSCPSPASCAGGGAPA